jgi:hypothetical protein
MTKNPKGLKPRGSVPFNNIGVINMDRTAGCLFNDTGNYFVVIIVCCRLIDNNQLAASRI